MGTSMLTLPGRFARRKVESALKSMFPRRMKRMCLLASLAAYIRNTNTFDQETLKALNETMTLAHNEDSLSLPIAASTKIWGNAKNFEAVRQLIQLGDWSREQISKICSAILDLIPDWLWYGDRQTVATDVELLLRHHKTVLGV